MEFLAIIISLGLLQYWGSGAPVHQDGWLRQLVERLQGLPTIQLKLLITFFLPIIIVALLLDFFAHDFLGIPRLVLLVVVLLYSMGRGNFTVAVQNYIAAWRQGDLQSAYHTFLQLRPGVHDAPVICNAGELHFNARVEMFYRIFERFFVPLFYFALLGFAPALLYRLLMLYRDLGLSVSEDMNVRRDLVIVDRATTILEWLPARFLGLTFAVMGDFAEGLKSWQSTMLSTSMHSKHVLNDNGCAAIGLDLHCEATALADEMPYEKFVEIAAQELQSIQKLYKRSALFWIACIAILQIF